MALKSTIYRFQLDISDIDRGVYENLDLRVACHPSEGPERMVVRVLARALAHEEGLEFGRGLSTVEEPALWKRSLTGDVELWVDVGLPGAERLHRASKRSDRLLVVTDKVEAQLRKEWSSRTIHQADRIEVIRLAPELVTGLASELDRSMHWYLTLQDGDLSVADGERHLEGAITRESLKAFLAPH